MISSSVLDCFGRKWLLLGSIFFVGDNPSHLIVTPHIHALAGGYVIGAGVHIHICVCGQKKLNCTLAIDSPFQTFTVGLLVEFID